LVCEETAAEAGGGVEEAGETAALTEKDRRIQKLGACRREGAFREEDRRETAFGEGRTAGLGHVETLAEISEHTRIVQREDTCIQGFKGQEGCREAGG
jgi:hypothetical protein